ncbi:MAG: hypothetical protein P4L53_03735 [Candidatus Obscuribacterales bacterium]|nr:hypothetical protein [Candidatus Obscuribacterales bacterium]
MKIQRKPFLRYSEDALDKVKDFINQIGRKQLVDITEHENSSLKMAAISVWYWESDLPNQTTIEEGQTIQCQEIRRAGEDVLDKVETFIDRVGAERLAKITECEIGQDPYTTITVWYWGSAIALEEGQKSGEPTQS